MEAPHVHIVELNGKPVHCYGEVLQAQQFEIDCMKACDDATLTPNDGKYFDTWEELAQAAQEVSPSRIIEIRAIL